MRRRRWAWAKPTCQRLIRDGRYDSARKVCELACRENAAPALRDHFKDRMTGLDLVGKAAPPITGTDVDGHPVSLADLAGKVVLVDFWATGVRRVSPRSRHECPGARNITTGDS